MHLVTSTESSNPIFFSETTYFTSCVRNMFRATILYKYHGFSCLYVTFSSIFTFIFFVQFTYSIIRIFVSIYNHLVLFKLVVLYIVSNFYTVFSMKIVHNTRGMGLIQYSSTRFEDEANPEFVNNFSRLCFFKSFMRFYELV